MFCVNSYISLIEDTKFLVVFSRDVKLFCRKTIHLFASKTQRVFSLWLFFGNRTGGIFSQVENENFSNSLGGKKLTFSKLDLHFPFPAEKKGILSDFSHIGEEGSDFAIR